MIPSALLRAAIPLLRILPVGIATRISHKFLANRSSEFALKFESAPLRYAPKVRMRLKIGDAAHVPMAFVGVYEIELSREIWRLARTQGGTLLDVGANYGYFSLLWCAALPENRSVAVEASPKNLDALRHNVEANGFGERIEILEWAASDRDGEVSFDQGPPEQSGWGGITHKQSEHTVEVPCHRLDRQLSGRSFTVLKIDCEGADGLVILGASGLLKSKHINHVFYEENEQRMAGLGLSPGTAQRALEEQGYCVESLGRTGSNEYHAWHDKF